jgi:hypothetical protein
LKTIFCVLGVLALPGCATVMEGTAQSVSIDSEPSGANCQINRAGTEMGSVTTPGSVHIDKSKNDLSVTCEKSGYQTATVSSSPHFVGTTFGNILIGGLVGVAVDAATGANYTYPENIHVGLAASPVTVSHAVKELPATAQAPLPDEAPEPSAAGS